MSAADSHTAWVWRRAYRDSCRALAFIELCMADVKESEHAAHYSVVISLLRKDIAEICNAARDDGCLLVICAVH